MAKFYWLAVFVILTITMGGCSKQPESARVVIENINGYTFDTDRQLQQFQTLAFEDGKVLATGDAQLAFAYPKAEKIDGQ